MSEPATLDRGSSSPRAPIDQLRTFLEAFAQMRARFPDMPKTGEQLILEHGHEFTKRAALAPRDIKQHSRTCYLNAWLYRALATEPMHYVEGYLLLHDLGFPVMHGWCVDVQGRVHDPSIGADEAATHFGVVFKDADATRMWKHLNRRRLIGIIPNLYTFKMYADDLVPCLVPPVTNRFRAKVAA